MFIRSNSLIALIYRKMLYAFVLLDIEGIWKENPLKYVKYFDLIINFLNFALNVLFDTFEIGNLSVETILLT